MEKFRDAWGPEGFSTPRPYYTDIRFDICGRKPISLNTFQQYGALLEDQLEADATLIATTNAEDYHGWGSATIVTDETMAAAARRERFAWNDLDEDLWKRSYELALVFGREDSPQPYMISMSHGVREPNRLFFYGQCMDEPSYLVLDEIKSSARRVGDGFRQTSPFMANRVRAKFGVPQKTLLQRLFGI